MREYIHQVNCNIAGKQRQFRLLAFEINPSMEDKDMFKDVLNKAARQGGVSLDPGSNQRSSNILLKTRYLGVLSEVILQNYLQRELGASFVVKRDEFSDYNTHVDLTVELNQSKKGIEIRGSFPYSALDRVICSLFDIIGPYSTRYKPSENIKDFYLRTLINQKIDTFDFQEKHTLYFSGGAEKDLFDTIGHWTSFDQQGARYRAIKPIAVARDCMEIVELIRQSLE